MYGTIASGQDLLRQYNSPRKVEALTLENKYYGYYRTSGSSYIYAATNPLTGEL